jgi:predicted dehydrogenase
VGFQIVIAYGMAGGGPGSFIGGVHRIAAELDGHMKLSAGVFSSDLARSRIAAAGYGVDPLRVYATDEEMIAAERQREDGIRMLVIATPNHLHFPAAKAALEGGFAVMSDKPATATLDEAKALAQIVEATGGQYRLSYTYTGYPMVREARERVARGDIGTIRKVIVEYLQGWLGEPIEQEGNKQASWRVDPAKAGLGGCIGDIGIHAFNLLEFVCGERVEQLCADLAAVVPGRALDDDCTVLLRLASGARGILAASQIATGERNGLRLRIYGNKGALAWNQEEPDRLCVSGADCNTLTLFTGAGGLGLSAINACRLPSGHPEGYLEALANLYRDFGQELSGAGKSLVPGILEGVRSMAFIERAVNANRQSWVALEI